MAKLSILDKSISVVLPSGDTTYLVLKKELIPKNIDALTLDGLIEGRYPGMIYRGEFAEVDVKDENGNTTKQVVNISTKPNGITITPTEIVIALNSNTSILQKEQIKKFIEQNT